MVWQKVNGTSEAGQEQVYWWDPETDETSWVKPPGVIVDSETVTDLTSTEGIKGPAQRLSLLNTVGADETEYFTAFVRLRTGVKFSIENCDSEMTIDMLKKKIAEHQQGYPVYLQRLSYEGSPLEDHNTLGFYAIINGSVLFLTEKTEGEISFAEDTERRSEMGVIKVAVHGMRGFWGCLGFCIICAAVGIPILLIASLRDQYTQYECVRGAAVELEPCDTLGSQYFCPISMNLQCDSAPEDCSRTHNSTHYSDAEQLEWFELDSSGPVQIYCCVDEFWCSQLYNTSLRDESSFLFGTTQEDNQTTIYAAWSIVGLACAALLIAIIIIIIVTAQKKYNVDGKLHVINTRQKKLKLDE